MAKSAEAAAALLNDPVAFMRVNLVSVQVVAASGLQSFCLDDSLGEARLPNGAVIRGYYLMPGDGGAGCFTAYWCRYEAEQTHSVVVGSAADLMFTATMNGCTLGIGSRNNTGNRLISHANSSGATVNFIHDTVEQRHVGALAAMLVSRSHQQYQQRLAVQAAHTGPVTLVEPSMYRRDANEQEILDSTTFGVRDAAADDWGFYVQKQGDTGQHLLLVGVGFVGGAQPQVQGLGGWCAIL